MEWPRRQLARENPSGTLARIGGGSKQQLKANRILVAGDNRSAQSCNVAINLYPSRLTDCPDSLGEVMDNDIDLIQLGSGDKTHVRNTCKVE